ncbi:MAG TPA: N-acetylmuramoyl-L-alanine amidase [Actinomycetota bacterium]|nr:N-acetylmuramoyl-L-alanine amidase [Actinomycetota bacterium]
MSATQIRRRHTVAARAMCLALLILVMPLARDGRGPDIRTFAIPLGAAREVRAPEEFGLVGVSWPADEVAPTGVEVRTSLDGRSWEKWTELEMAIDVEGPDLGVEDRGRRATSPLWVGRAQHVQVRWHGAAPRGAEVQAVDPGPDPQPPAGRAARAIAAQPGIITRAQWGADESIRRCCPRYSGDLKAGFIHHTATSNNYSRDQSASIVRSIYAYHVQSNGWDDIGYNFLVDRYGQVFEGRAGGLDRLVIGAHAAGFNTSSVGVSLIGTFESVSAPAEALDAVQRVLAWKFDLHHVDPTGTTQMVSGGSNKYPAGQTVSLRTIASHRDVGNTSCPGDGLYNALPSIRTNTYNIGLPKLFDTALRPTTITPNGDGRDDTMRLTGRASAGANWTASVTDGTGAARRAWSGTGSVDITWDGRDAAGLALPHGDYTFQLSAASGAERARPATYKVTLFREPWTGWTRVGGAGDRGESPRTSAAPDGSVHWVIRGIDNGLYRGRWVNGEWHGHVRLGGSHDQAKAGSPFAAVVGRDGTLHVVVQGTDDRLYHGRVDPHGSFLGWSRIGAPENLGSEPALTVTSDGAIHMLMVSPGGALYANIWLGRWLGWLRVGADHERGFQTRISAAPNDTILATVVGTDAALHANLRHPHHGWLGWSRIGTVDEKGTRPSLEALPDSRFIQVVEGVDQRIYANVGTPGTWSGWHRVGSGPDAGLEPELAVAPDGTTLVVITGTDARLYANVRRPDGSWAGWRHAGEIGITGSQPSVARSRLGPMVTLAQTLDLSLVGALSRPPHAP